MSLKTIHLAADIENSDEFHLSRLLLLLRACGKRSNKPVDGIMKLAKLDFLLRYPNCLVRVLKALNKGDLAAHISEEERNTIEARMIRFRFGPWDERYRRWIGLLVAKRLAHTYVEGRTVKVVLTDSGLELAESLAQKEEFQDLAARSTIISTAVGSYNATKLKDFVYKVFPEIATMKWGEEIEL
ncbi:MAG: hypothetical protein IPN92_04655 [Chromatiaceae bacterium]|nr:hypothetical protein [Chromatiaceae bacterium]